MLKYFSMGLHAGKFVIQFPSDYRLSKDHDDLIINRRINVSNPSWSAHEKINMVKLATSLAAEGILNLNAIRPA